MVELVANTWGIGMLFVGGLFAGMLLMLEVGRRVWLWRSAKDTEAGKTGRGAVEGATFALLGLLIAFTFSGAAARFDTRRELIVQEANDIGTAYLRLDLLPPAPRAVLQEKFRQYLDARLAVYRAIPDMAKMNAELARAAVLRGEIWSGAISATQQLNSPPATMLLLPALNAAFDTATTRHASAQVHPPNLIFGLLIVLCLACALFAGLGMADRGARSWIHIIGFAAILTMTIYVIIDLEYPRLGLIRIARFEQVLVDTRSSMDERR
jgi:hypothetical protein